MTSPNSTFTELVTTTLRHHKRRVADNVTDHNGLLTLMKERGNIKTDAEGGTEIVLPLSYAENSTLQRYSGYDTLNVGASDVLTAAKYDWRQMAIHVTASGREIRMNRSEERLIDLVNARVDVAYATAANTLSVDIYSDGALTNQIGGLQHLLTSDGTGTVGGINAGNYPFWKNQFLDFTTPGTYSVVRTDFNKLWMACQRGKDMPDLIVSTHDIFSVYEGGLQDNQRYTSSKMAALGFESLMYKSAPIIFDTNSNYGTTAERVYFLNTKYLFLMEHPEARWTEEDERVPVNQDAIVVPIYWMGQMCCSNRSLQGLLFDS